MSVRSLRIITAIIFLLMVVTTFSHARGFDTVLREGKFGKAIDLSGMRQVTIPDTDLMRTKPIVFEFWTRLSQKDNYNILLATAPKDGLHWEVYTEAPYICPTPGVIALYMPQLPNPILRSSIDITDNKWHFIAFRVDERRVELYVDGVSAIDAKSENALTWGKSPLKIGGIEKEPLGCTGLIDDLKIGTQIDDLTGYVPTAPAVQDRGTFHIYRFDSIINGKVFDDMPKAMAVDGILNDEYSMPEGNVFLDELQEEEFKASGLFGDAKVEDESRLPIRTVKAEPFKGIIEMPAKIGVELSGEWLMKECDAPAKPIDSSPGVIGGWWQQGLDRSSWRKVSVPTTVQNALVKSGELADPFWNSNTYDELNEFGTPKDQPWHYRKTRIEQKEWWFAKTFTLPKSWKGGRLRLYFDGIDYSGSVYLNGKSLGHHAGMFGGPTLDITGLAKFDGPNELVVRLDKTADTWNGILKGSPGFGWHYGHLISTGIWRGVQIDAISAIEVDSPYVMTKSITKDKAVLSVEYYIDNHGSSTVPINVVGLMKMQRSKTDLPWFSNKVQATPGRTRVRTEVTVNNPQLWWPMNYGKQNLYNLELLALTQSGHTSDMKTTTFGIRTIEMRPMAGTKAKTDYRWQFVVNGQPMFIKGANWCWSDPMLQLDSDKYERILELARRGGIQMFRAWGGGIIETDEFYRKCDEKGIMVYQEFPYCWGPPPFPITDAAVLDQQVSQVVKRLRNHPSLIMWGGGNENGLNPGGDEALFLVGRRCRQFDPSRPYHRTDPWGGSAHNWSVFHSGAPIDSGYKAQPSVFYGEYGLPSMTNRSSALRYLPESALGKWPVDDSDHGIIAHLNQFMPFDLIKTLKYADYGPVKDWDTYIEYSQMAQGDWLRFAAENQRASSGENKSGFWFYKFTDLFPGHSWAVVDFYGTPKLSYFRAKQVCRPRSAFAVYPKFDWAADEPFYASLNVANDTMTPLKGAQVKAAIFGSDMTELWKKTYAVPNIPENKRIDLDSIEVKLDPAKMKPFVLAVSMRGPDGSLISDQWYWFNFKAKTQRILDAEKASSPATAAESFAAYAEDHEAPLLSFTQTTLSVTAKSAGGEGYLMIKNNGNVPAFNVIIDGFPDGNGNFLGDNSFCLWPGEDRKVGYILQAGQSVAGISVRAWNAPVAQL
ncbi:MAG: glycosyl hydrolase 2 galactose-binding domain-containing protein [Armatimonadota bacterium]